MLTGKAIQTLRTVLTVNRDVVELLMQKGVTPDDINALCNKAFGNRDDLDLYLIILAEHNGSKEFDTVVGVTSMEAVEAYFREQNARRKANGEPEWVRSEPRRWTDGAWDMVVEPGVLRTDL